jgi:hypothetical protein
MARSLWQGRFGSAAMDEAHLAAEEYPDDDPTGRDAARAAQ